MCHSVAHSSFLCARLVWMKLLLNSFSLVPLLVGICAEMDDTSFEFVQFCSAAGARMENTCARHNRWHFHVKNALPMVYACVFFSEASDLLILACAASARQLVFAGAFSNRYSPLA